MKKKKMKKKKIERNAKDDDVNWKNGWKDGRMDGWKEGWKDMVVAIGIYCNCRTSATSIAPATALHPYSFKTSYFCHCTSYFCHCTYAIIFFQWTSKLQITNCRVVKDLHNDVKK